MENADRQAKQLERAKRLIRSMAERTEERGFTEAEAMESAAQMGALLKQWDLDLDEVLARDVTDMVQREVFAPDDSAGRIITGIGRLCSLIAYRKSMAVSTTYVLYGHAADVELGVYLWEICAEAGEHGWVQYMQQHGHTVKKRESFRMGYAERVADRMYALREERDQEAAKRAAEMAAANPNGTGTNLVLLKDQLVVQEFEKTGVRLTKGAARRVADAAAFRRGGEHGATVNLNRPLAGNAGPAGLLT